MLEFDRAGVPQDAGDPAQFDEYVERCTDLYHARSANDKAVTLVGP